MKFFYSSILLLLLLTSGVIAICSMSTMLVLLDIFHDPITWHKTLSGSPHLANAMSAKFLFLNVSDIVFIEIGVIYPLLYGTALVFSYKLFKSNKQGKAIISQFLPLASLLIPLTLIIINYR